MKKLFLGLFILYNFTVHAQHKFPTQEIYTKLLKKHVTAQGKVDYKGFIKDSIEFNQYLKIMSTASPQKSWTANEQKAYWINAYNAFTIKLIMKYYPVKSVWLVRLIQQYRA